MSAVLTAEDDDRLAELVVRALVRAGHDVERVPDGESALRRLREGGVDVALLDVDMPGLDGVRVLTALRAEGIGLPVLLVTGDNAPGHVVAGLEAGADDYITKPFRFDELVARVDARLRAARLAGTVLASGPTTVDLVAHTASTSSRTADLPPRELALLEYLLRRPGRTVSREQLLHDVWGLPSGRPSNVVDVYVRYLRRRLGPEVIETVRGAGYRAPDPAQR
jgi:two-component system, OmpR family, copper resistance phosphate regulon response regulator CusR